MENSKIEWTHHTFNPWLGCAKVSPGCQHCYAETMMDTRFGKAKWGVAGTRVRTSEAYWKKPLAWNRKAERAGERQRVFCASLADVFEDRPELVEWRADLFALIDQTPWLDWLLLTKRPENIERLWPFGWYDDEGGSFTWTNVWLGVSVEDQARAEERIPYLTKIPAMVRFLSCEPLLGPIDLNLGPGLWGIDWVIVGGESGPHARPMHPDWVRSIKDACRYVNAPFFFKQWGEWIPNRQTTATGIESMMYAAGCDVFGDPAPACTQLGDGAWVYKVGKADAGHLLDGCEWREFPSVLTWEYIERF